MSRHIVVSIPQAITRGGQAARVAAGRQGDDAGGAFARSIRRRLEVAFKALPKADVRLGDTGFNADLARLRARMETLRNKTVGVDVSAVDAEREIVRISAELERLGATHTDVNVRADTATARAALASIRAEIAAVDAKDIRVPVRVDTSQATSALMSLGIQIAALTAIPLGPVLLAGLGGVAAMATAAGVGFGALALAAIPAIKGVTSAIQLKSAAEDEAKNATDRSASAAAQASQRTLQLASAQAQLASAHRNAAKTIESAQRAVAQAQQAVTDAVQRAAEQRQAAADGVRRAEQSLADAQRAARQAEQSLTQARADATQQLKALNDQLIDGALDQREATLRVQQAQEDLNATLADPTSTQLQQEAAQLALDRAKQGAKEQAQNYAELKKSAEAQRKAGVEGADAVRAATERVGDAQRTVADQTETLAKAHEAAAKAQRDGARSIAEAQAKVADSVRASADAQVSAAESVASAQRGVDSARLTSAKATDGAISKEEEYRKALANLTPAARGLFDAIAGPSGLKTAFDQWQKSLQPAVLPLFTHAVDGMKNSLPALTPLVKGAADGIKSLMDSASAELKTPFWTSFKDDLDKSVKPAVVGFGKAFGNVVKGIAGVIDAFLPHMDGIAKRSDKITDRFAKWGSSLKGSPKFEKFLGYVKDTAPGLADFIGRVLTAALDVSKAVAPLSTTMMAVIGPVFDAVSWLATNNPGLVQALWGLWAAQKAIALGMVAFSAAMAVYQSVMLLSTIATAGFGTVLTATGIGPIIRAILIVVGLLVAGFVLAYNNSETFRKIVDGAWSGIKETVSFIWNSVLKPAFSGIWTGMKAIGDAAMWLWNNALGPAFGFIADAAQFLVTALITLFLLPAYLAIKALGKLGMWLWDVAIGPAFRAIGDAAKWLWEKALKPVFGWIGDKAKWLWEKGIKPAFGEANKEFDALGRIAKWLWDKAVKPVFGWIGDKAKWLWEKAIKPPFEKIKEGVDLVAAAFKLSKDNIKKHWDQLQDIAKKPVRFIIDHVYNGGIVPLWNRVADVTGADKIKKMDLKGFATGGIMPGYSPGIDNHVIAVSGGEAIMRPEVTRAVGASRIHELNAAARSGGISGVQRAIANGMPAFKDGGIFGSIWGGLKSAGGAVVDGAKSTADLLTNPDKVFNAATSWAKAQMRSFASSKWGQLTTEIPVALLKSLKNSIFGGDGSGTAATGGVGRALMWARSKAGFPYQWGGAGNPSFDCSGFMSSIQKVILGQVPKGRLWSTFSFQGDNAPAGWVRNLRSPFQLGVTNAGVGHTAGTLAGVNVESRGGAGVVVGKGARGWNDPLFTSHYGFAPAIGNPKLYDSGGYLPPGLNLVANGTGKPEPVFTAGQWADVRAAGNGGTSVPNIQVISKTYLDGREVGGVIDHHIELRDAATGRAIETGRYI
ncbi:hypothetical protein OG784_27390 [Streptomyces sp. NBC_01617]|uniref:hypothetical protein n=1 Tax=Streptomyces sp. NBC_01617 TaxID=2975899 RepID=UPI003869986D|nr:hypothetical protein OG784_27390 [Streptomyces sp. NBC_01617]